MTSTYEEVVDGFRNGTVETVCHDMVWNEQLFVSTMIFSVEPGTTITSIKAFCCHERGIPSNKEKRDFPLKTGPFKNTDKCNDERAKGPIEKYAKANALRIAKACTMNEKGRSILTVGLCPDFKLLDSDVLGALVEIEFSNAVEIQLKIGVEHQRPEGFVKTFIKDAKEFNQELIKCLSSKDSDTKTVDKKVNDMAAKRLRVMCSSKTGSYYKDRKRLIVTNQLERKRCVTTSEEHDRFEDVTEPGTIITEYYYGENGDDEEDHKRARYAPPHQEHKRSKRPPPIVTSCWEPSGGYYSPMVTLGSLSMSSLPSSSRRRLQNNLGAGDNGEHAVPSPMFSLPFMSSTPMTDSSDASVGILSFELFTPTAAATNTTDCSEHQNNIPGVAAVAAVAAPNPDPGAHGYDFTQQDVRGPFIGLDDLDTTKGNTLEDHIILEPPQDFSEYHLGTGHEQNDSRTGEPHQAFDSFSPFSEQQFEF